MEDNPVPRPWKIGVKGPLVGGNGIGVEIQDAERHTVVSCCRANDLPEAWSSAERDAALIVRAVNSYEAHRKLAEETSYALSICKSHDGEGMTDYGHIAARLRAALAAVEAAEKA